MDEILIWSRKKCPKIKIVQQGYRFPYQKLPGPLESGLEPSIFQKLVSYGIQGVKQLIMRSTKSFLQKASQQENNEGFFWNLTSHFKGCNIPMVLGEFWILFWTLSWYLCHHILYVQVPQKSSLPRFTNSLQSKCDLFICTGTVTHYTSLAIHQGCIISDSAQEKMGTFSVPKSLQESLQKRRQQADSGKWVVGHDRVFCQHHSKPQTLENATFEKHCFRTKHLLLLSY